MDGDSGVEIEFEGNARDEIVSNSFTIRDDIRNSNEY